MKMAFSGSQRGMTGAAYASLKVTVGQGGITEFHHGDCIGSDALAAALARDFGIRLVCHPPTDERKRAFAFADESRDPLPYLVRNHEMVDECDCLVATPSGPERLRSGTWATVRYARRKGRPVIIIRPDGHVVIEQPQ